jgi:hypothetical protein
MKRVGPAERSLVPMIHHRAEGPDMSHYTRPEDAASLARQVQAQRIEATQMSAWVGWIAFAGTMMALLGSFHVVQGLVALFRDEVFLVGKSGLTVGVDYTAWGWIHIVGGIVIAVAGFSLFTGRIWARTIGVIVAMVSAVVNIGFLAAYPIWSVTMIAIDILVIWALTVHGREIAE